MLVLKKGHSVIFWFGKIVVSLRSLASFYTYHTSVQRRYFLPFVCKTFCYFHSLQFRFLFYLVLRQDLCICINYFSRFDIIVALLKHLFHQSYDRNVRYCLYVFPLFISLALNDQFIDYIVFQFRFEYCRLNHR